MAETQYANQDFADVNVPSAKPPETKDTGLPGAKPLDVDTSLVGQDPSVNDNLGGSVNPALSAHVFFPTVSETQFNALNLPAQGIRLTQAPATTTTTVTKASSVRNSIISYAKKFLGTPYVWGGTTPRGFDCSGFVQYVLRANGKTMPRIAYEQARMGTKAALANLRPGDLIAWDHSHLGGADHIAIYIGNGQIIEAPHTGANVRIRKLGKNENFWGVHLTYKGE